MPMPIASSIDSSQHDLCLSKRDSLDALNLAYTNQSTSSSTKRLLDRSQNQLTHSEQMAKSISDLSQDAELIKQELIRSMSRQSVEMLPDNPQIDIPTTHGNSSLSNPKQNHQVKMNNGGVSIPTTSTSLLMTPVNLTNNLSPYGSSTNHHHAHLHSNQHPNGTTPNSTSTSELRSRASMNHVLTEKMSRTNLYIKGLCENFDDEQLWQLPPDQTKIKSVKAAIGEDTKCRGYGFIDFISEDAANEALAHIKLKNPSFTIKFAKENEKDKTNLYVTNLPKSWATKDSDQLKTVFERFGSVQSAFVMMERLTNKSTGVGFVRFVNERDALNALDSLKNNPLILPECSCPVEAKFADKHNPETRRRRYPATAVTTVLPTPSYNSLINYPLYSNDSASLGSQDMLTTLINNALVSPAQNNHMTGLNKSDFTHPNAAATLLPTLMQSKHQPDTTTTTNNHLNLSDPSRCNSTSDSNLAALAAAASTLFGGTPNGYVADCLRSGASCNPGTLNHSLNGGLLAANPVALLTNSVMNPADAKMIDPSLCGCSPYGTDYFRTQQQQQQQQQLLSVAMAAMTNPTLQGCLYPSSPDMSTFAAYHNLINSHPQNGLNLPELASCLSTPDTNLNSIYANQTNGLSVAHNPMPTTLSHLSDPMVGSRPDNGLYQWVIPTTHLIKNGGSEYRPTIPSTAISINHINQLVGLDKVKRHVQTFI